MGGFTADLGQDRTTHGGRRGPGMMTGGIWENAVRYFTQHFDGRGEDLLLSNPGTCDFLGTVTARSLEGLAGRIASCRKCGLAKSRNRAVPGAGNPRAGLMLVGEAPGQEEDLRGEPFVGAAGRLLEKMIGSVGFTREEVYITNILKCRPPMNRDPHPDEIASCLPVLERQIALIRPALILALGRIAGQTLLRTGLSVEAMRGKVHESGGRTLMVTYHPAALLRSPDKKRPAWEDLKMLRKQYDLRVGDKTPWNPPKQA
ncbi:uracil-DNA glycosylase [bacterium]|nr:uracil-DNA glycosylase [bacterium]